jgi:hypothetical protein
MNTFFLICFVLGLVLSLLAAFGGLGRLHFGHFHGHVGTHAHGAAHSHHHGSFSAINGFTLPAFLGWFGGAGYLLYNYSPLVISAVLLLAIASGLIGAGIIYVILFKLLLPRERVLSPEDTRMDGVVARVSDEIRANGGIGEILFSQLGARRGAPARSESGEPIARGTEVVVLRYAKGIAYVSPLDELMTWDRSQQ